jgi:serine/threonine protein kinase/tetratricopeptide (TPR) repeat protein
MVGQTLGRYRIVEQIGHGGMGVVYLAHDERLDREVAVKVLPSGLLSEESVRARFRKEAMALAKLNHPNIATIHDFDTQTGMDFLVTEYIPGTTLSDRLLEGPLEQAEIIRLGIQLCDGLAAAHEHNVIHRDLKPSNLRVTPEGRLKILDFGLARLLRPSGGSDLTQSITDTHAFAGTIPYMSPEQLRGDPPDPRNDLYAAGVVLYEMASGRKPFPQKQSAELIAAILNETPASPSSINDHISTELDEIILKAIDKQPEKRYQKAATVIPDLERLGHSQGQITPNLRQPRWRWAAVLAFIAVILTFALVWGLRTNRLTDVSSAKRQSSSNTLTTHATTIAPLAKGKYVAVLPFEISGEDAPVRGYLAHGLMEALSARLSRVKSLRIASEKAVARVRVKDSLEQMAQTLGVNLIVQGTIQSSGNMMVIVVNLIDAANGKKVWTQQFTGLPKDLLTLEDQIVAGLVTALDVKPLSEEIAAMAERPTNNEDAYARYLRGRQALSSPDVVNDAQSAINYFEEAITKDRNFALAYTGLADASLAMYAEKTNSFWLEKARAAARQAEQINDNLPEAHFSLGAVYLQAGKTSEAIAEFKHGIQVAPNSDEGYVRLGDAYTEIGQKDEAIAAYKKAIEVNPYYWGNHLVLGNVYWSVGANDKAVEEFKRVTELDPENVRGWDNLGTAYSRMGKYQESINSYQKSLQLDPTYWSAYTNLGNSYFLMKRYPEAIQAFEKAVELGPNYDLAYGNLADAYRVSGQKGKADATYDKAIALALHAVKKNPKDTDAMEGLALYYAKKGDTKRGMEYIQRARGIDKKDVSLIYCQATVEALGNRRQDALRTLREALAKGYSLTEIGADPELAMLRNTPEFEQLWGEYSHRSK